MKLFFPALLAILSLSATAQNTGPTYAAPACQSGCSLFNNIGTNFYFGASPKSFRVCSAKGFPATIAVDNQSLELPGNSFNVRSCIDVTGMSLGLVKGEIAIGSLPN